MIKLEFEVEEVNILYAGLMELPAKISLPVANKLMAQSDAQLQNKNIMELEKSEENKD